MSVKWQEVSAVVAVVAGIFTIAGAYFNMMTKIDDNTSAISKLNEAPINLPKDTILISKRSCSDLKLETYKAAEGRFLVGVGEGVDKNAEKVNFTLGKPNSDTDGEYSHSLTIAEMPKHHHVLNYSTFPKGDEGDGDHLGGTSDNRTTNSQPNGEGVSHNNILPWVGLYFCTMSPLLENN